MVAHVLKAPGPNEFVFPMRARSKDESRADVIEPRVGSGIEYMRLSGNGIRPDDSTPRKRATLYKDTSCVSCFLNFF